MGVNLDPLNLFHHNGALDPHRVQESLHAVPDELKHVVKDEFLHAAGEAAEIAFRKSAQLADASYRHLSQLRQSKPDLVEAIDGVWIDVSMSIVTFHYEGFYGRAEGLCRVLKQQSEHFQLRRSTVRWLLENTGPTTFAFNISGELFTSAISAGVGFGGPLAVMVELLDLGLEHLGVPE